MSGSNARVCVFVRVCAPKNILCVVMTISIIMSIITVITPHAHIHTHTHTLHTVVARRVRVRDGNLKIRSLHA